MGMLVNFKAISSVPLLIFGFVYSVLAILAKVIGCGVPALFFNFNLRGALRIGFGMLPRGEVALIMARSRIGYRRICTRTVRRRCLMVLSPPWPLRRFWSNC